MKMNYYLRADFLIKPKISMRTNLPLYKAVSLSFFHLVLSCSFQSEKENRESGATDLFRSRQR